MLEHRSFSTKVLKIQEVFAPRIKNKLHQLHPPLDDAVGAYFHLKFSSKSLSIQINLQQKASSKHKVHKLQVGKLPTIRENPKLFQPNALGKETNFVIQRNSLADNIRECKFEPSK